MIGRDFELSLLAEACDVDAEAVLAHAAPRRSSARILVRVPGTAGRYRFAHALVRDTLYEELPPAQRVALASPPGATARAARRRRRRAR